MSPEQAERVVAVWSVDGAYCDGAEWRSWRVGFVVEGGVPWKWSERPGLRGWADGGRVVFTDRGVYREAHFLAYHGMSDERIWLTSEMRQEPRKP